MSTHFKTFLLSLVPAVLMLAGVAFIVAGCQHKAMMEANPDDPSSIQGMPQTLQGVGGALLIFANGAASYLIMLARSKMPITEGDQEGFLLGCLACVYLSHPSPQTSVKLGKLIEIQQANSMKGNP